MQSGLLWDIFCTVIDNHGDLGVCWRLSRQLRDAGQRVRLWLDDASALGWMAPAAARGEEPGIEIRPWAQASEATVLAALPPANVWIEAFGCEIPEAFVARGVAKHKRQPAWINLEYLSAEDWVARMHGLPSPVMSGPAKGWSKRFFTLASRPTPAACCAKPTCWPGNKALTARPGANNTPLTWHRAVS